MTPTSIKINCREENIELPLDNKLSIKDNVIEHYGWLLNPLIENLGSYSKALDKLQWKISIV